MTLYLSLLCHLIGDYVLQSHVMATRKTSSWKWAAIHAAFYSIPFVALALLSGASLRWLVALAVIGGTHAAIDRLAIALRWCRFYGVGFPGLWWRECCSNPDCAMKRDAPGSFEPPPPFIGVWLVIIVDNTLHLCINTATVLWATHAAA